MTTDNKNTYYCSFCGKSSKECRAIIAGPAVYICNECVDLCAAILMDRGVKMAWSATEES